MEDKKYRLMVIIILYKTYIFILIFALFQKIKKERADNRENISSIIGSASLRLALW